MQNGLRLTSGGPFGRSSRGFRIPTTLLLLKVRDCLVDLGPHVLERLGGTTRHDDTRPVDLLAILLELGNNAEEELILFGQHVR